MFNQTIKEFCGFAGTEGTFGVELEMVADKLPKSPNYFKKVWQVHGDGSLRGADTAEYVLSRPLDKEDLKEALDLLGGVLERKGIGLRESIYAGTHVHLNCQQFTIFDVVKVIVMYYCLEPLLIKYSGKYREGNHFCLSASDADWIVNYIRTSLESGYIDDLFDDSFKYSALNLSALGKYGSLEFRSFRSTYKTDDIYHWCMILNNMKEAAVKYESPGDIVSTFSTTGVYEFVTNAVGKEYVDIFAAYDDFHRLTYSGVRNAQDIALGIDWGNLKNTEKPNKSEHFIGGIDVQTIVYDAIEDNTIEDDDLEGTGLELGSLD